MAGGKKSGSGRQYSQDGCLWTGAWKKGMKEGPFTVRLPDGRAQLCRFEANERTLGVQWSADRQLAWRLVGSQLDQDEPISLDEAAALATEIGLPVPPRWSSEVRAAALVQSITRGRGARTSQSRRRSSAVPP